MTRNELEFAISQYLDGTLNPHERAALERRLREDADARALFDSYQRIDRMLKARTPLPAVRWDRLAERISAATAREEAPIRSHPMPWVHAAGRVAVAASVLLAMGMMFVAYLGGPNTRFGGTGGAYVQIEIFGPQESVTGPAIRQISIGPASDVADWRYAEGVVTGPSRVHISRGDSSPTMN